MHGGFRRAAPEPEAEPRPPAAATAPPASPREGWPYGWTTSGSITAHLVIRLAFFAGSYAIAIIDTPVLFTFEWVFQTGVLAFLVTLPGGRSVGSPAALFRFLADGFFGVFAQIVADALPGHPLALLR